MSNIYLVVDPGGMVAGVYSTHFAAVAGSLSGDTIVTSSNEDIQHSGGKLMFYGDAVISEELEELFNRVGSLEEDFYGAPSTSEPKENNDE